MDDLTADNETNEEDEELLLHDIDDGDDFEAPEDFTTLYQHMETDIERMLDRLENSLMKRQPMGESILPIRRNETRSLPQVTCIEILSKKNLVFRFIPNKNLLPKSFY